MHISISFHFSPIEELEWMIHTLGIFKRHTYHPGGGPARSGRSGGPYRRGRGGPSRLTGTRLWRRPTAGRSTPGPPSTWTRIVHHGQGPVVLVGLPGARAAVLPRGVRGQDQGGEVLQCPEEEDEGLLQGHKRQEVEDSITGHVDEPVLRVLQRAEVPQGDRARAVGGDPPLSDQHPGGSDKSLSQMGVSIDACPREGTAGESGPSWRSR